MQRGLHSGLSGFGIWTTILQFGGETGSRENGENVLTKTDVRHRNGVGGIGQCVMVLGRQWASGGLGATLKTSRVLRGRRGSVSASGQGKTD